MHATLLRCLRCSTGRLFAEQDSMGHGRWRLQFYCLQCGYRPAEGEPLPLVRERLGEHGEGKPKRRAG